MMYRGENFMYVSRVRISNGKISLAFDSMTGELLELISEKTGENYIKNSCFSRPQGFLIEAKEKGGEKYLLTVPFTKDAIADPSLRCSFEKREENGDILLEVRYKKLYHDQKDYIEFPVSYSLRLKKGEAAAEWKITLKNNAKNLTVEKLNFPYINGIVLGDRDEKDKLYVPVAGGMRIEKPCEFLTKPVKSIQWRWQEYRYNYVVDGYPAAEKDGYYQVSARYPGELSMSYIDYCDESNGFYLGIHDGQAKIISLNIGTYGAKCWGMNFDAEKELGLSYGEEYVSPPVVMALHGGDWREGADIYRAFRQPLIPAQKPVPAWQKENAGLVAHYDFIYQNGGIVHTYDDIPALAEKCKALGLSHMLIAGWHEGGFDKGFPSYYAENALGGEEKLREGVRAAREKGVYITPYINSRLVNTKLMTKDIEEACIVNKQGEREIEKYGNEDISFYTMCPMSGAWQKKFVGFGKELCEKYGFAGLYMDVFATAPHYCYNKLHGHTPDAWREGYQKILADLNADYKAREKDEMCLIYEWAADVYAGLSCGQLIQTFGRYHTGAFPEMYRYTFPDHIIVDMLYPEKNMAMRPVHIGKISEELMRQAYTLGFYFWIYDLEEDNTFDRDREKLSLLKRTIAARTAWLKNYGAGRYLDDCGIKSCSEGVNVKVYDTPRGKLMAYFNDAEGDFSVETAHDVEIRQVFCADEAANVVCAKYSADKRAVNVKNAKIGFILFDEK